MEHIKVLIAEDDALTRMDLRTTLEDLGLSVVAEAEDGHQAVTLAQRLHPDLVIADVKMPRMDGLEMARIIRMERLAAVVLLTGYDEESLVAKANSAGVLAYLRKPFRKEDFMPAISIALGRYRERLALEAELADVKQKMEARKIVGRAKALLMERYHLTEREAFHRIHTQSQLLQKPPHEIAEAIITASGLGV